MNELEEKNRSNKAISAVIKYLDNNNLIKDLVNHIFITIEPGEVTNKITYYKDGNGKLYNLYEIKRANLNKEWMERIVFYRCEEIKKVYFDDTLVEEKKSLNTIPSKSYSQIKRTYQPLKSDEQLMVQQLHNLINEYPCLLIEIILYYNISIDELIKSDNKKLVLN